MRAWETDTFEKLQRAEFDPPDDRRRFFSAGDNQIAGVGDGFQRNSPPWIDTVKALRPDFPVYGSMMEVSECLTRLVGQENMMMWMGEYPDEMGFVPGIVMVDMQLEHATRASLPSPRFPGEQGWYFNQGEKSGITDDWFTVSALVNSGH